MSQNPINGYPPYYVNQKYIFSAVCSMALFDINGYSALFSICHFFLNFMVKAQLNTFVWFSHSGDEVFERCFLQKFTEKSQIFYLIVIAQQKKIAYIFELRFFAIFLTWVVLERKRKKVTFSKLVFFCKTAITRDDYMQSLYVYAYNFL